jgi:hypothetical protein
LAASCFHRWDAKPDNQFGQSFPKGFNKPAHPAFIGIVFIMLGLAVNWRTVREYLGFSPFPEYVQVRSPEGGKLIRFGGMMPFFFCLFSYFYST